MDYHFKVWLEEDGQSVFGDGLHRLLTEIGQQGSIRKAADTLHMSYRQAWGHIKKAESRLGVRLLIKQVGGESGGGAQLTPEAEKLMQKFRSFRSEVEAQVDRVFQKHFK